MLINEGETGSFSSGMNKKWKKSYFLCKMKSLVIYELDTPRLEMNAVVCGGILRSSH